MSPTQPPSLSLTVATNKRQLVFVPNLLLLVLFLLATIAILAVVAEIKIEPPVASDAVAALSGRPAPQVVDNDKGDLDNAISRLSKRLIRANFDESLDYEPTSTSLTSRTVEALIERGASEQAQEGPAASLGKANGREQPEIEQQRRVSANNDSISSPSTVALLNANYNNTLNETTTTNASAVLLPLLQNASSSAPMLELSAFEAAQLGYFRHSMSISVILTIAYTIVFVVGIVGNSFVVAIVCKSPRMRTVTNYFIANLALADILVLLFCLPATLVGNLFIPWVLGQFVCKAVSYLQGVAVSASINTMVTVTMDRFLAICFPLDWHMSRRTARWVIACIWLFSLSISLPWALYFTQRSYALDNRTIQVCAEEWPNEQMGRMYFVCANLILLYLFPATVIILCYLGIWYRIERRNIPGDQPPGLKIELIMQKSKLKVVKMMMVVVVLFLLSWLPSYIIFALLKLKDERSPREDWLIENLMPLAQWLGASNSCINPILYTFFNRKYKRGFVELLRFAFCCKPLMKSSSLTEATGQGYTMANRARGGGSGQGGLGGGGGGGGSSQVRPNGHSMVSLNFNGVAGGGAGPGAAGGGGGGIGGPASRQSNTCISTTSIAISGVNGREQQATPDKRNGGGGKSSLNGQGTSADNSNDSSSNLAGCSANCAVQRAHNLAHGNSHHRHHHRHHHHHHRHQQNQQQRNHTNRSTTSNSLEPARGATATTLAPPRAAAANNQQLAVASLCPIRVRGKQRTHSGGRRRQSTCASGQLASSLSSPGPIGVGGCAPRCCSSAGAAGAAGAAATSAVSPADTSNHHQHHHHHHQHHHHHLNCPKRCEQAASGAHRHRSKSGSSSAMPEHGRRALRDRDRDLHQPKALATLGGGAASATRSGACDSSEPHRVRLSSLALPTGSSNSKNNNSNNNSTTNTNTNTSLSCSSTGDGAGAGGAGAMSQKSTDCECLFASLQPVCQLALSGVHGRQVGAVSDSLLPTAKVEATAAKAKAKAAPDRARCLGQCNAAGGDAMNESIDHRQVRDHSERVKRFASKRQSGFHQAGGRQFVPEAGANDCLCLQDKKTGDGGGGGGGGGRISNTANSAPNYNSIRLSPGPSLRLLTGATATVPAAASAATAAALTTSYSNSASSRCLENQSCGNGDGNGKGTESSAKQLEASRSSLVVSDIIASQTPAARQSQLNCKRRISHRQPAPTQQQQQQQQHRQRRHTHSKSAKSIGSRLEQSGMGTQLASAGGSSSSTSTSSSCSDELDFGTDSRLPADQRQINGLPVDGPAERQARQLAASCNSLCTKTSSSNNNNNNKLTRAKRRKQRKRTDQELGLEAGQVGDDEQGMGRHQNQQQRQLSKRLIRSGSSENRSTTIGADEELVLERRNSQDNIPGKQQQQEHHDQQQQQQQQLQQQQTNQIIGSGKQNGRSLKSNTSTETTGLSLTNRTASLVHMDSISLSSAVQFQAALNDASESLGQPHSGPNSRIHDDQQQQQQQRRLQPRGSSDDVELGDESNKLSSRDNSMASMSLDQSDASIESGQNDHDDDDDNDNDSLPSNTGTDCDNDDDDGEEDQKQDHNAGQRFNNFQQCGGRVRGRCQTIGAMSKGDYQPISDSLRAGGGAIKLSDDDEDDDDEQYEEDDLLFGSADVSPIKGSRQQGPKQQRQQLER